VSDRLPLSLRSITAGGQDTAPDVARLGLSALGELFPTKLWWFLRGNYMPHGWQAAFHAADRNGRIRRFRHLAAGRRGGKTLSAAREVTFYCEHPREFHRDAHGADLDRGLIVWVLTKDHTVGLAARMAMQEALNEAGLIANRDYKWNKTEKSIEFLNSGTLLQFRSAEDPQSLRGLGLDILWIDEAAFVRDSDAWQIVRPSLSDKAGIVITTTTPHGKNWFWDTFFQGTALTDEYQFRVEYTSIDSPHFLTEEWEIARRDMHPAMFKQEYMAAFDAMSGLTLSGEWLQWYTRKNQVDHPDEIVIPDRLRTYLGVDPSTGDSEDEFAIALIGLSEDSQYAFLLDYWKGHIQFPEQVQMIQEWQLKYRPNLIGVEANAYQKVLTQQVNRLASFPAVVPVMSRGNKNERIISMSPLFKIGKVRIHPSHVEFIDQWVSFDGNRRDNRDDLLDAVEVALGVAGVMLPGLGEGPTPPGLSSMNDEAAAAIQTMKKREGRTGSALQILDPDLGEEW